ncbi:hypothetical protein QN352_20390 [Mucilaginibacter sp. 10I4]|nr:hypothetical protein [Mucilaginibacter sp. 10I4]MEB0264049.1 hypothetical protein [Mucilaginibacter sp. 10I4]
MKVLIVLTSHSKLGNTGEKTGFWIEEFAAPYYVLADAGVELTIASPKGGQPPIDPKSEAPGAQTPATLRFNNDQALKDKLANTIKLSNVSQIGDSGAIDTSLRNVRQTIPEHFDHIKSLIINFIFSTCLHKSVL